jgi:hypothetical protein
MIIMTTKEEKELVIARLRAIPDNALLSIGFSGKPMNRNELIDHVKKEDSIGESIIEMQLSYLRSFKKQ